MRSAVDYYRREIEKMEKSLARELKRELELDDPLLEARPQEFTYTLDSAVHDAIEHATWALDDAEDAAARGEILGHNAWAGVRVARTELIKILERSR